MNVASLLYGALGGLIRGTFRFIKERTVKVEDFNLPKLAGSVVVGGVSAFVLYNAASIIGLDPEVVNKPIVLIAIGAALDTSVQDLFKAILGDRIKLNS